MEPKQQPPYPLRMPPEMRTELEKAAFVAGRSLNSEILWRLQESLAGPRLGFGPGSVGQRLIEAEEKAQAAYDRLAAKEAVLLEEVSKRVHAQLRAEADAAVKQLRKTMAQAVAKPPAQKPKPKP